MIKITFDKNDLVRQLRTIHGAAVFGRGRQYYEDGLVGKLKIADHRSKEKIEIRAQVYGTDTYITKMIFNFLTSRFSAPSCSCPYNHGECKHSAALGLAFVDIWKEACLGGGEFCDFEEIKNLLIGVPEGDGDDLEYIASQEDSYQEAEIIDIAGMDNATEHVDKQERKKERLNSLLQMIGISTGDLSPQVLDELEDRLGSDSEIAGKYERRDEEGETLIDLAKKYHLILDTGYVPRLSIRKNENAGFYHWENEPSRVMQREGNKLAPFQHEFLEFLGAIKVWYGQKIDWGRLFELARASRLDIFMGSKAARNKLSFRNDPQKIAVALMRKETKNYLNYGETVIQDDFSFQIRGVFSGKKAISSFCGAQHLVIVRDREIAVHQMTKRLSNIIERLIEAGRNHYDRHYHRHRDAGDSVWTTDLVDGEIVEINEVIADAQECFDLQTDLPKKFEVKKFKKIGPAITVDYDSEMHNLRVSAGVDYGFSKIDVAHMVRKSMQGGKVSFQQSGFYNREKYHIKIQGDLIYYADIAHNEEKGLFSKFHQDEKYGFPKSLRCMHDNPKKIAQYYKNHWPHIKASGYPVEFVRDEFKFFEEDFKADFDVDMNAENDWLAFDVACYLGKDRITLEDLKSYLSNKEEFIRTNDGRMLKISNWEELEKFVLMLESFHRKENGSFEGRAYHAPELQNVFVNSQYYSAKVAEGFRNFISEAQSGQPVKKVKLPARISRTLRDYQKDGVHWFHFLRKYRFAGILADDMGLGKTLQALTLLEMNKVAEKPSIVICPKTLLFNWEQEAKKFFPNLKVMIIEGAPKERIRNIGEIKSYDLIITSYSTIKKDSAAYEREKIRFNYCFLDEAQFIKNHKTQNAQAVKKIDADYKLALTGTPLENSVAEIWSVFDFLMPGFLGNFNHFTKRFLTPIMKKSDAGALQALRKKTECFMLRRTKGEVLKELPPKIEQTISSELTEAQNILYQEILANVKSEIFKTVTEKGFSNSQIHILAGLMKLRQVCNHPTLLLKNKDYAEYDSAKLDTFKELVGEIVSSGRKVLVFSQFTQMLDILGSVLEKEKIEYLYLSGKTKNRQGLVEEFNASDRKKVFLISLRAGGTGLNLTSADNVIIFDPWWNPSVENQAIDRTHRIGQKNSVNVYRLITKGTIEEKIVQLQEKKKVLFDNLVGESQDLFKKLTWEDVKALFE